MKTKNTTLSAALLATLIAIPMCGAAAPLAGIEFTHGDWQVACDNTRTCRAAGYQASRDDEGEESLPVSVLFTRKAGPREPVKAELQIGNPGDGEKVARFPDTLTLRLHIDDAPLGGVVIRQGAWTVGLASADTAALLAALRKESKIEWKDGEHTWRLSGNGAAAVFLKMDEFQGRLGTSDALLRSGPLSARRILPAVPAPVVRAARVPADGAVELPQAQMNTLRAALAASAGDECPALRENKGEPQHVSLHRVSDTKLLASATCWMGAGSVAEAKWVVNAQPPFAPQLVTTNGDYARGRITANEWAGGYDCMRTEEWTWDGSRFVRTSRGTTGMCRNISMGGAWSLPVLVTDVRPAP